MLKSKGMLPIPQWGVFPGLPPCWVISDWLHSFVEGKLLSGSLAWGYCHSHHVPVTSPSLDPFRAIVGPQVLHYLLLVSLDLLLNSPGFPHMCTPSLSHQNQPVALSHGIAGKAKKNPTCGALGMATGAQ